MTAGAPADGVGETYRPATALRGSRVYVHSTDLYTDLMDGAVAAGWMPLDGAVELRIRHLIKTEPDFHFDGADTPQEGDAAARFMLTVGARARWGRIVASDRAVTARKPYDERRIWDLARLTDRQIALTGDSGLAPIEVVTALGVLLHNTLLAPPAGKRWLLARLALLRPLQPADARTVTEALDHVLGGSTRTVVATPGGPLGTMQFVLGTV